MAQVDLRGKTRVVSFREFHELAVAHVRSLCCSPCLRGCLAPEALDFALNSFKVHSQTSHKMRKLGDDKLKAKHVLAH